MNSKKTVAHHIRQFLLVIISSLLFVLANPNLLFKEGLGFLGFFVYLPVLFVIKNSRLSDSWYLGAVYGALTYALYGYWLKYFHPLGLALAVGSYTLILTFVFFCLKLIDLMFKKNAWLVQWLFICAYEYVKTLGFAGMNYGVTAYTQWKYNYLIQICDVTGVFVFNLFVIFPSAFLFSLIYKSACRKKLINNIELNNYVPDNPSQTSKTSEFVLKQKAVAFYSTRLSVSCAVIWCVLLLFFLVYGFCDIRQEGAARKMTVAAIQNNESPWKDGVEEYAKNVQKLMELTDEAFEMNDKIRLVVWPETAVVPSIMYNFYESREPARYKLIVRLLEYIESSDATFVIGNAHQNHNVQKGFLEKYNSAFVFEPGKNVFPPDPGIYFKMKLVPFTEEFPYETLFPRLYQRLLNGNLHMWEKGSEYKVFNCDVLSFATPICFEDTFDYICRNMVLKGARCFVNLSNDSWSESVPCQNQHLAMAVFRSVENRVPSVRSTSSGKTCIINEHGKIVKSIPDFCYSYVIGQIPVFTTEYKMGFFTKNGNLLAQCEAALLLLILIIQFIRVIIIKKVN